MKREHVIGKKQIICLAGGVLLYVTAVLVNRTGPSVGSDYSIERNSYGQGERSYELLVEGLNDEELPVEVRVAPREYTAKEAQEVFDEVMEQIGELIRGDNPSLDEVRHDLKLITRLDHYGISLEWESEDSRIIDTFGTVTNRQLYGGGRVVYLGVRLSDGIHEARYQIKITVLPPIMTKEEKAVEAFLKELASLDRRQRTEKVLKLPQQYHGRQLLYREKENTDYKILLVLGVLLAVLCRAKDQSDERRQQEIRSRQLLLDYSDIISKLVVFLGAGMTVPLAWEKVVKDYEKRQEKKGEPMRFAYEEMRKTYYQMKSGTPEGQAYQEFGRRCQLRQYVKLGSLLDQNRKTGTKNLRNLLQMEVAEAFEQRKHLARKMGEEASTRLLIPLFLMLGIVMLMIIVPAFLSFA